MGAFSKLTTAALTKMLKRHRGKLQVLEDVKKGRTAERNFLKQDPFFRASQGKRPLEAGNMFRSASPVPRSVVSFPKANKIMDKAIRTTPQLRVGVTKMVKELRRRGGKLSSYRGGLTGQNAQKEINKMQKAIKKAKKAGYKLEYGY